MALEEMIGGFIFPQIPPAGPGSFSFLDTVIDASGEKVGFVFQAPKSGVLHGFEFRLAGSPPVAANGLRLSFRNMDPASLGADLSTTLAYRTTGAISAVGWIRTDIMTDDGTDTGTPLTVTRGQKVACLIEFENFTAGDTCTMRNLSCHTVGSLHTIAHIGGTWTGSSASSPIAALKYQDGTYPSLGGNIYPISSGTSSYSLSSSTTPDELAMRFSFPTDVLIGAAWVRVDLDADMDLILYDGADNVIESISILSIHRGANLGVIMEYVFTQPRRISANETYRLSLKPTTTTNSTVYCYTADQPEMLELLEGGALWALSSRTDGGDWADSSTVRPWMGVRIVGIDHEIGGQPSTGFEGTP
jgi:hypothetical protein